MQDKKYFKTDMRDPYTGNTLPIKIEVGLYKDEISVVIVNPEGTRHYADEITHEMFIK